MSSEHTLRTALSEMVSDPQSGTLPDGLDALDHEVIGQALYHYASAAPLDFVARLSGLVDHLDPLGEQPESFDVFAPDHIRSHVDTHFDDSLDDDGTDADDRWFPQDDADAASEPVHHVGPGDGRGSGPVDDDLDDDDVDVDADQAVRTGELAISVYDDAYESADDAGIAVHSAFESTPDRPISARQGSVFDTDDDAADDWDVDLDTAPALAAADPWNGADIDEDIDDDGPDLDDLNDV